MYGCRAFRLLGGALASVALFVPSAAHATPPGEGGLRNAGKGRPAKPLGTHAKEEKAEKQLADPALAATTARQAARRLRPGRPPERSRHPQPRLRPGRGDPRPRDPPQLRGNGAPESTYPASNYGFDIFIDTGIDAPTGTFAKGFVMNGSEALPGRSGVVPRPDLSVEERRKWLCSAEFVRSWWY